MPGYKTPEILRVASRRIRSDFLPRLRTGTFLSMTEPSSPRKALAYMQMETETTACRHAAEMVRRPDNEGDGRFSAASRNIISRTAPYPPLSPREKKTSLCSFPEHKGWVGEDHGNPRSRVSSLSSKQFGHPCR